MSNTPINRLTDNRVAKTVGNTVPLIRAAVLAVSVAAAIPTAHNLYYSWTNGIPYSQVPHRLAQYDLWVKNFDCKVDYRALLTAAGTKVDVGACPKSQDIAIKISTPTGQSSYEWIAFDQLQKPVSSAGLLGLVITSAMADETAKAKPAVPSPAAAATDGTFKLAQSAMQVMCQVRQGGDKLVRVVQEAGKCYRETMSMLKGTIDKREEVACTTPCPK